jgi:uncharacterized Zn-binding protein involved in type VI secretion
MPSGAARVDDDHDCMLHDGRAILVPGASKTRIDTKPAARVGDHAECIGAPNDTIRGGLLTVFIDGSPAARIGDATDIGTITQGSSKALLGVWAGGPLHMRQAQWLYDYMASQNAIIPFEFAPNGCYARADRMSMYFEALGIDAQKQWAWDSEGEARLRAHAEGFSSLDQDGKEHPDSVVWRYHVAPVVEVIGQGPMIIDPSLEFGGPVTVDTWIATFNLDARTVVTTSTDASIYFWAWDPATEIWITTDEYGVRDVSRTAGDLQGFRTERAGTDVPESRRLPDAPVHY